MKKKISFIIALLFLCASGEVSLADVTPTPSATPSVSAQTVTDLNSQIHDLEQKVTELKTQGDSLASQIGVMDNQAKLTEYRINSTQTEMMDVTLDIDSATKRMANLEGSLTNVTKVLLNRIVATYQAGSAGDVQVILNSNNIEDLVSRANYLRIVQQHDKKLLYDTQQARNDYANQKIILENKKKKIETLKTQLEDYTKQLTQQKVDKQKLLAETQGSEGNYQRLLSQAKAQLAGFRSFTSSQGGSSLLGSQTVCDDWGCYYNQRDSQWGGNSLNGTQYSLASDGCLVTSMAMVYTHFGHRGVTPQTINSDPGNFASYYPAFLRMTITADGSTASRVSTSIDSELSAGRPVVVGISYDSGPMADHFLVLISGSGGNYQMNDPYTPNGHNIPLSSKYSVGSIREIYKVTL
jgi:peptidoglycan hydrolase CwlO-like protein